MKSLSYPRECTVVWYLGFSVTSRAFHTNLFTNRRSETSAIFQL
jgi:hypothetical protein